MHETLIGLISMSNLREFDSGKLLVLELLYGLNVGFISFELGNYGKNIKYIYICNIISILFVRSLAVA